jgi:hypothetical protein
VRRLAALVVVAACSAGARPPGLPPAGSPDDDGTGQLARASAQIELGGAAPGGRRAAGDDGLGGTTYGGGYGGTGHDGGGGGIGLVPLPARQSDYAGVDVPSGGAIDGVVRWPRPPAGPVRRRSSGEVEGALVYLVQVERGRPFAGAAAGRVLGVGGLVERRDGALWPALQVVAPAPAAVTVSNAGADRVVLVGTGELPFRSTLAAGDRRTVPAGAGVTRVADDAGRLTPAWIIGLGHPYYALTDAAGRFRLDQVPPGRYQLEVWHPPVAGAAPVIVRRAVAVTAAGTVRLAIDLP